METKITGNIKGEMTITLVENVEATEERGEFQNFYRFSMPVNANLKAGIAMAKEVVVQLEKMEQKAEAQKKEEADSESKDAEKEESKE